MASSNVDNVVFCVKRAIELFYFGTAIWTLAPLYHRNFTEFRGRLWVWIGLPIPMAIDYSYDFTEKALEWLATTLLQYSAVQRIVRASGIPRIYFDVLPSVIMLIVTIYLCVRFVLWSRRLGKQKIEQTEAQRLGNVGSCQEKEEPGQAIMQHVPPSVPSPN